MNFSKAVISYLRCILRYKKSPLSEKRGQMWFYSDFSPKDFRDFLFFSPKGFCGMPSGSFFPSAAERRALFRPKRVFLTVTKHSRRSLSHFRRSVELFLSHPDLHHERMRKHFRREFLHSVDFPVYGNILPFPHIFQSLTNHVFRTV